ncbi:MAG: Plug domain-containing protein [Gemmatimonadetes bacterium]|nr:Plug domain-containing protein [Gemmatimonadota bacterium]
MPAALGEVDLIRSLTLLPGVSSSSDFTTAINVRGGGADQNLILLDEATIYNPAHILGFLSVFNSDAVDDATLYKGAIPPRFGGASLFGGGPAPARGKRQRLRRERDNRPRRRASRSRGRSGGRGRGSSPRAVRTPTFAKASSDPDIKNSIAYFTTSTPRRPSR